MNHLPVEVLLNVFSFIPKEELITIISQVCQRWKDIAKDPSLYRTLDLVNDDPDTRTAIKLLSATKWLTYLKLHGRTDTDVLIPHIGVNHPHLVKLVLLECQGSRSKKDVSAMQLRHLVRRCLTVQHLSLMETLCYSNVMLTEIGENLHDLRVITISDSLHFNSEGLISITNNCYRIEKIYVDSGYETEEINLMAMDIFSENVVANFCDKFKESLTCIVLNYATWTNASLASLSRCANVNELQLGFCSGNVTDEGIMSLCQMKKLEFLTIYGYKSNMTSMGWVRLFKNTSMKSLVKVSFYIMNINIDRVVSAISRLPNITDLDISGHKITEEGLLSMSKSPNLTHLRIYRNTGITSYEWIRFFETSKVQQKMTHLQLLLCANVNDEVAKVISQNLRKLQQLELSQQIT